MRLFGETKRKVIAIVTKTKSFLILKKEGRIEYTEVISVCSDQILNNEILGI